MERSLFKAAEEGDTNQLKALFHEDRLLLAKIAALPYLEDTPLHIATLAEHTDFVREMLKLRPSFVWDGNKQGQTPLHIASAIGNIDIVREILRAISSPDLIVVKDKEGLTALHYAAMKGRVEVMGELLSRCPEALREVTANGETAFHLAVIYSKAQALKFLVGKLSYEDQELINAEDCHGNSIVQLAKRLKQLEVLNLLRNQGLIKEEEISEEEKTKGEAITVNKEVCKLENDTRGDASVSVTENKPPEEQVEERVQSEGFYSSSEAHDICISNDAALFVEGFVAQMTYQAVLSPPQTIWNDNMNLDHSCIFDALEARTIFASPGLTSQCRPTVSYYEFMLANTIAFLISIFLIFLTILMPSALPRRRSLFVFSLLLISISYFSLMESMTPDIQDLFPFVEYGLILSNVVFIVAVYGVIKLSSHPRSESFLTWMHKRERSIYLFHRSYSLFHCYVITRRQILYLSVLIAEMHTEGFMYMRTKLAGAESSGKWRDRGFTHSNFCTPT